MCQRSARKLLCFPNSARLWKMALALCLASLFSAQPLSAQTQGDIREAAAELTKKLTDNLNSDEELQKLKGERIFIAEFQNINSKENTLPRILQEKLTTAFINAKYFKIIERSQLDKALKELNISSTALFDPDKAKAVGKQLSASYMLVGSLSEDGGVASVDARIVSIETGQSVVAADANFTAGKSSSKPGKSSPANPLPGMSSSAGQSVGSGQTFGLPAFVQAWREKLGSNDALSFSAGDVRGDGNQLLVTLHRTRRHDRAQIRVLTWDSKRFKEIHKINDVPMSTGCPPYLRVLPIKAGSRLAPIVYSDLTGSSWWGWNGTTFVPDRFEHFRVVDWVSAETVRLVGFGNGSALFLAELPSWQERSGWMQSAALTPTPVEFATGAVVSGDFDGDGKLEFATVQLSKGDNSPIQIYGIDGRLKASIEGSYGGRLTTWKPGNTEQTLIVVRKNKLDDIGKMDSGYIEFVAWNGQEYQSVWKSVRLGSAVLDMQVCDPKGEGETGLVVLSQEKGSLYLTKIVPGK